VDGDGVGEPRWRAEVGVVTDNHFTVSVNCPFKLANIHDLSLILCPNLFSITLMSLLMISVAIKHLKPANFGASQNSRPAVMAAIKSK